MGIYIDPPDMTKEEWLKLHAQRPTYAAAPAAHEDIQASARRRMPSCLVDNGPFTAAGVADTEREFEELARIDGRHKVWYAVTLEDLLTVPSVRAQFTRYYPGGFT